MKDAVTKLRAQDDLQEEKSQIVADLQDEELKRAIQAEQKASKAKSAFLSTMSHEMRTPLNVIVGMTQIALETKDPHKIEHCLKKIRVSSIALLSTINNILDMSKIEADKLELAHEVFSLESTLNDVCSVISVRANEKKQELYIHTAPDIPDNYSGDAVRLGQVFMNLLSNAVKFTPPKGVITLSVRLLDRNDVYTTLEVRIKDTGIGMTEEETKTIFEPYVQAKSGSAWRENGTGLGLPMCKEIVERMQGCISVNSELGEGSEFVFCVQLENVERESKPKETQEYLSLLCKGKQVLLVDDAEDSAEVLNEFLKRLGVISSCASNGKQAVEMFTKAEGGYDLILMDIKMPVMDGYEAARQIRRWESHSSGRVPIIAVTANAFKEELEKCIAAGMDDYITKPLDKNKTIKKVITYLTQHLSGVDMYAEVIVSDPGIPDEYLDVDIAMLPLVDYTDGLDRVDGDVMLYSKLLEGFASGSRKKEFEDICAQGTDEELAAIAHLIKGLASNFSLLRLQYTMAAFEQELMMGKRSRSNCKQVSRCFDETIDYINKSSSLLWGSW